MASNNNNNAGNNNNSNPNPNPNPNFNNNNNTIPGHPPPLVLYSQPIYIFEVTLFYGRINTTCSISRLKLLHTSPSPDHVSRFIVLESLDATFMPQLSYALTSGHVNNIFKFRMCFTSYDLGEISRLRGQILRHTHPAWFGGSAFAVGIAVGEWWRLWLVSAQRLQTFLASQAGQVQGQVSWLPQVPFALNAAAPVHLPATPVSLRQEGQRPWQAAGSWRDRREDGNGERTPPQSAAQSRFFRNGVRMPPAAPANPAPAPRGLGQGLWPASGSWRDSRGEERGVWREEVLPRGPPPAAAQSSFLPPGLTAQPAASRDPLRGLGEGPWSAGAPWLYRPGEQRREAAPPAPSRPAAQSRFFPRRVPSPAAAFDRLNALREEEQPPPSSEPGWRDRSGRSDRERNPYGLYMDCRAPLAPGSPPSRQVDSTVVPPMRLVVDRLTGRHVWIHYSEQERDMNEDGRILPPEFFELQPWMRVVADAARSPALRGSGRAPRSDAESQMVGNADGIGEPFPQFDQAIAEHVAANSDDADDDDLESLSPGRRRRYMESLLPAGLFDEGGSAQTMHQPFWSEAEETRRLREELENCYGTPSPPPTSAGQAQPAVEEEEEDDLYGSSPPRRAVEVPPVLTPPTPSPPAVFSPRTIFTGDIRDSVHPGSAADERAGEEEESEWEPVLTPPTPPPSSASPTNSAEERD